MFNRPEINNPTSPASTFRRRRFRAIEAILTEIVESRGTARIIDIGGRRDYWNLLSPRLASKCSITLLNLHAELDVGKVPQDRDYIAATYHVGDACGMPEFEDGSFDLAHSNSVIEHVGSLENMVRFAQETRRVGVRYYVQTPNLWFPIEPHYGVPFVHWLPAPTRAQLLHRVNLGYAKRQADYLQALAAADHTQIVDQMLMRRLFPDGTLTRERFAGLTKSITMVRRSQTS